MWTRGEKEALAVSKGVRVSPIKLNSLAKVIRGKSAASSLSILKLSSKISAKTHLIKVIESAMANAENNHNLDIDSLFVKEATVNKYRVLKRIRPRAKGRADRFMRPYSSVRVVLEEREAQEPVAKLPSPKISKDKVKETKKTKLSKPTKVESAKVKSKKKDEVNGAKD